MPKANRTVRDLVLELAVEWGVDSALMLKQWGHPQSRTKALMAQCGEVIVFTKANAEELRLEAPAVQIQAGDSSNYFYFYMASVKVGGKPTSAPRCVECEKHDALLENQNLDVDFDDNGRPFDDETYDNGHDWAGELR